MSGSGEMIDWGFAVSLAGRLIKDGPEVTRAEADAAVAELRVDAALSADLVRAFTGLEAPTGTAPLLVIDRTGWVQANADGFATLLGPVVEQLSAKHPPTGIARAVGRKVAGAEVGGLLGFLATKVLGQFDPFYDGEPGSPAQGRLLLVAPNIVHVERELEVDPTDFRLWVCLHEETHRVQFTANPWLREYLIDQVTELASLTDAGTVVSDLVAKVSELVKGHKEGGVNGSLVDLMSTPEQRVIFDRLTAVMSLLEGHADVVMDGVGPTVIPSVAHIRSKFTQRRKGVGGLDRLLRRLLGMDAKMAQYRDGAVFVRHAVDAVGMERFNTVWTGPETLPTLAEIHAPEQWISRVVPDHVV
jgi:coenzyme F420 biosynthesis associated uncharacterized protein